MTDDRRDELATYMIYGEDGAQAYVQRVGVNVDASRPVDNLADVLNVLGARTSRRPLHQPPRGDGHNPALELATQLAGVELGAYDHEVVRQLADSGPLGLAVASLLRRVREDAARVEREQLLARVQRLGMKYARVTGNEGRVYRLMWEDTLALLSGGEEG
jgi:hypothetical protein